MLENKLLLILNNEDEHSEKEQIHLRATAEAPQEESVCVRGTQNQVGAWLKVSGVDPGGIFRRGALILG